MVATYEPEIQILSLGSGWVRGGGKVRVGWGGGCVNNVSTIKISDLTLNTFHKT